MSFNKAKIFESNFLNLKSKDRGFVLFHICTPDKALCCAKVFGGLLFGHRASP